MKRVILLAVTGGRSLLYQALAYAYKGDFFTTI